MDPRYEGLEKIYRKYKDRGFVVLGFPCNQFAKQEPGTAEEVCKWTKNKFEITFPIVRLVRTVA